jgi:phage shock protein PspC (stress-responsive transcriptional regulator)
MTEKQRYVFVSGLVAFVCAGWAWFYTWDRWIVTLIVLWILVAVVTTGLLFLFKPNDLSSTNMKQRIVLALGLAAFACAGLPQVIDVRYGKISLAGEREFSTSTLIIIWTMVSVVTAGLFYLFQADKRKSNSKTNIIPGHQGTRSLKISQAELDDIIRKHNLWLWRIIGKWIGKQADLAGADLTGAQLRWVNLTGANLTSANLTEAKLCGTTLFKTDLRGATLHKADLSGANLSGANLSGVDLTDTIGINSNGLEAKVP